MATLDQLRENAAETAALIRGEEWFDLWVGRLGNMEFLTDQMFGDHEHLSVPFNCATMPDLLRHGYIGYHI